MNNKEEQYKWWKEVMYRCDDISVVDRDFARCRYDKPYPEPTFECCFEKCPKIDPNDKEREYKR